MPKYTPTARHRDNLDVGKEKLKINPKQIRLPTEREMKRMSVREKLLTGVAFSFARRQQQQHQKSARKPPSYVPVATLQKAVDAVFHVNPNINRNLNDGTEPAVMLPRQVEDGLWGEKLDHQREILSDHFHLRISQRRDASRRLQAVLRQSNNHPFEPPVKTPCEQGPGDRLRLFLQSACREYGYRKLQLDLCGFMTIKVHNDLKGEPLGSVPREPIVEPTESVILLANRGNITLYESDIPDQFGRITTWMWLKICRPLEAYEPKHHPAPDLSKEEGEEGEAWAIIAIPKPQIATLEDAWRFYPAPEEETHGDYMMDISIPHSLRQDTKSLKRRMGLAFRYSRDGVPSIASSNKGGGAESMWFGFRTDVDQMQWERVLEAMKTNSCLVHVLSRVDAGWIHVDPEKRKKIEQPEAQTPRKTKRLSGARRSSNLKNEVYSEEY
ncbi:hypothetical protein V8C35DRAFT_326820 [Trichoderma chlorosporum]